MEAGKRRWRVLLSVGLATFMTALDGSVANTIVPLVRQAFHAELAAVQWIVTIYLLTMSGLLLSFGRLGDLRGHKRVFVWGYSVFVVASLLCALAPSLPALVTARALKAVGAAMLQANAPALLTAGFPAAQRGRALGLMGTMTYLGLTTGPPLGGALATMWGWRAVFLINLPLGLAAAALALACLPTDTPNEHAEPFDALGAGLFLVAASLLLLGLNQGHRLGWQSRPIVGLLLAALVTGATFVRSQTVRAHPMLDLRLFRNWTFTAATASALGNYVGVYCAVFVIPLYLIEGRGLDAAHAGLLMTAQPLVMAASAPWSGTLSDRVGARLPSTLGLLVMALGLLGLGQLGAATGHLHVAACLALVGLGTGIFTPPNNSALLGAAPRDRQGIASGVMATARNFGMVLGVAMAGAVVTTIMARPGGTLVAGVDAAFRVAAGAVLLGAGVSGLRGRVQ